jgi:hypothetical protein
MAVAQEQPAAVSLDDLHWRTFPIPGSTPDVQLVRLHVEPDKAFTTVVRFPEGWSRPDTGWYDHIEEVLFLEGTFQMSGITYGAGDYGWFPAGYSREGSSSAGALALAWFSGPNQWFTDPSPVAKAAAHGFVRTGWQDLPPLPSPLGPGDGRLLVRSSDRTSWVVDAVPSGAAHTTVELFSLPDRLWARVEAGTPLPDLAGPVFCRVYSA